jgi:hypothetical protein
MMMMMMIRHQQRQMICCDETIYLAGINNIIHIGTSPCLFMRYLCLTLHVYILQNKKKQQVGGERERESQSQRLLVKLLKYKLKLSFYISHICHISYTGKQKKTAGGGERERESEITCEVVEI